jgi:hypothetical protein
VLGRLVLAFGIVLVLAGEAVGAPAGILTLRPTGQVEAVDPIVSPGSTSAHRHQFWGVRPVHSIETSNELRTHESFWTLAHNRTAIWLPPPMEDGVELAVATSRPGLAYYQTVSGTEVAFPDDRGSVVGNANARSPAENPGLGTQNLGYRCGIGGGTFRASVSNTRCDARILVITGKWTFPGFPNVPDVKIFLRYRLLDPDIGTITLDGRPDFTLHLDYFPAHDRAYFDRFLSQCLIPARACGTDPVL